MLIGICGAHRTGKTTLAKAASEQLCMPFIDASVSGIFREIGFDPTLPHSFGDRLDAQFKVLRGVDALYATYAGETAITDRTPLDFIAYTMAEAVRDHVQHKDQAAFAHYVQACFDVVNKRFSGIVLVQPGIELVANTEKVTGALNHAFIEHLNTIFLGLLNDERLKIDYGFLTRDRINLDDRIASIEYLTHSIVASAAIEKSEHLEQGRRLI